MSAPADHPLIGDYGLIGDCQSAALVSREASIDWCCLPRFDSGSCFGRLLDRERGGYCSIRPLARSTASFQSYLEDTLVLSTVFRGNGGEARVLDCFAGPPSTQAHPHRRLLRIIEGVRGHMDFAIEVVPRFDYGTVEPWLRHEGVRLFAAVGGDDALVISADAELSADGPSLEGTCTVRAGERVRLSLTFTPPEAIDRRTPDAPDAEDIDAALEATVEWWREWASRTVTDSSTRAPGVRRSALALKALTYAPTGAIAAAPTTSLPERLGGTLNWDYRYAWIRDSSFCVRSLAEVGHDEEADEFRRFISRSAAGSAQTLQVLYGVGGGRRVSEQELPLEGYGGARPVRVGNGAANQLQLDAYGDLVQLTLRWHRRGNSPSDDHWRFLVGLVDFVVDSWREKDSGLWEMRGDQQHFVHSKVMCWAAVDGGLRLAEECTRKAPERRWASARTEIREAVEAEGYDEGRGVFTQAFGSSDLDAAVLLLPTVGFLDWGDERMVSSVDVLREELDCDGLLFRYSQSRGNEGAFLACSFWAAECLAEQGRPREAGAVFDRALSTANHVGLFSEQYGPEAGAMLGNFPQGLTHYAHIAAARALARQPAEVGAEEGTRAT